MDVESFQIPEALSHANSLEVSFVMPQSAVVSSGIHMDGKQKPHRLLKLFNERLPTKSLKYNS